MKSKSRVQYYVRMDSKERSGMYLSKKNRDMIRALLQKKYDKELLKQVNLEISLLEKFIRKSIDGSVSNIEKIKKIYSNNPKEIKQYITPIDVTDEDYVEEWLAEPYKRKTIEDLQPVYITDKGERVRSKSELNIANHLYKMNIPYKYECPLVLSNGMTIYPDFTILDVTRRREVYWEHRGMMDDRYYLKNSIQRIKDYCKEGIVIGDNLVITEETSYFPLGTDEIHRIASLFIWC